MIKIRNRGNNKIWVGGVSLDVGETKEVNVPRDFIIHARNTIPGFIATIVVRKKKSEAAVVARTK
jgi:hypothetical protein